MSTTLSCVVVLPDIPEAVQASELHLLSLFRRLRLRSGEVKAVGEFSRETATNLQNIDLYLGALDKLGPEGPGSSPPEDWDHPVDWGELVRVK